MTPSRASLVSVGVCRAGFTQPTSEKPRSSASAMTCSGHDAAHCACAVARLRDDAQWILHQVGRQTTPHSSTIGDTSGSLARVGTRFGFLLAYDAAAGADDTPLLLVSTVVLLPPVPLPMPAAAGMLRKARIATTGHCGCICTSPWPGGKRNRRPRPLLRSASACSRASTQR